MRQANELKTKRNFRESGESLPEKSLFFKVRYAYVLLGVFLFTAAADIQAAQIMLEWNMGSQRVDGCRIFMRGSGDTYDYSAPVWQGAEKRCVIYGLKNNTRYYFVARAFKGAQESADSKEVLAVTPALKPPVGDAGKPQIVVANTRVTLNGSGSNNPDGGELIFRWKQTSGLSVSLTAADSAVPNFKAPMVTHPATLQFALTVTNKGGLSDTKSCMITVYPMRPADSDGDGIADADEIEIHRTSPAAADTDGDGIGDGDEVACGSNPIQPDIQGNPVKIWFESEDGDIQAPMEIADSNQASNGSYVWTPEGSGELTQPSLENGRVEFDFHVSTAGHYVIWGNVDSMEGRKDPFFIAMDDASPQAWRVSDTVAATWTWERISTEKSVGSGNNFQTRYFYLTGGDHTLSVSHRQEGAKLDNILITNDFKYIPTNQAQNDITALLYEDAEDGDTLGWDLYDKMPAGASITNRFDKGLNSRVIQLNGAGMDNGYRLVCRKKEVPKDHGKVIAEWKMNYATPFKLFFDVQTTKGHRFIFYAPTNAKDSVFGEYILNGLGSKIIDGKWRSFSRDIQADLHRVEPNTKIVNVNAFLIRGNGRLDDIRISTTR